MADALYDEIGRTYDLTRKADPEIVSHLLQLLSPKQGGIYLDVGCGSGNYTNALFEKGIEICGVDISQEMLSKARNKNPKIEWFYGDARHLPFSNNTFDGATCILATHHIGDLDIAFSEVFRVIKSGTFVMFTSFPEQIETYWLCEYFPKLMKKAAEKMANMETLSKHLQTAGFSNVRSVPFFITDKLQDWFLHAGKYKPEIYLDPKVRAGISTFAMEKDQEEIIKGCEMIRQDIASGKIQEVIKTHENEIGDYAFVAADKIE